MYHNANATVFSKSHSALPFGNFDSSIEPRARSRPKALKTWARLHPLELVSAGPLHRCGNRKLHQIEECFKTYSIGALRAAIASNKRSARLSGLSFGRRLLAPVGGIE